jgi:hypothetical protein
MRAEPSKYNMYHPVWKMAAKRMSVQSLIADINIISRDPFPKKARDTMARLSFQIKHIDRAKLESALKGANDLGKFLSCVTLQTIPELYKRGLSVTTTDVITNELVSRAMQDRSDAMMLLYECITTDEKDLRWTPEYIRHQYREGVLGYLIDDCKYLPYIKEVIRHEKPDLAGIVKNTDGRQFLQPVVISALMQRTDLSFLAQEKKAAEKEWASGLFNDTYRIAQDVWEQLDPTGQKREKIAQKEMGKMIKDNITNDTSRPAKAKGQKQIGTTGTNSLKEAKDVLTKINKRLNDPQLNN